MLHEQLALERKNHKDQIDKLDKMFKNIESDFAECARTGKSPCFFCANDDHCDGESCNFKWMSHN